MHRAFISPIVALVLGAGACLRSSDCWSTDLSCSPLALILSAEETRPRWVVVGANGSIYHSADGVTQWQDASTGVAGLVDVAYGPQGFIAVGANGAMLGSPGGESGDWTERNSGTTVDLRAVAAGNGVYAVVGGVAGVSALILSSGDGINWFDRSPAGTDLLNEIVFTGAAFEAVGDDGSVFRSTDGLNWTDNSIATADDFRSVAFGSGRLLVGGSNTLYTGADSSALALTGTHTSADAETAVFAPAFGLFVIGGDDGNVFTTADGVGAADFQTFGGGEIRYDSATDGGRVSIASASGGGVVFWSDDGTMWNTSASITANDIFGITYAEVPERFIAD